MDSKNKDVFDVWQKSDILSKSADDESKLVFSRLKFLLLDDTIANEPQLIESLAHDMQSTFDEYCGLNIKHKKNRYMDAFKNLEKKNLSFSIEKTAFINSDPFPASDDVEDVEQKEIFQKNKLEFKSAAEHLGWQKRSKSENNSCPSSRKNLGTNSNSKHFVSPMVNKNSTETSNTEIFNEIEDSSGIPEIKGIEKKLVELIMNDIIDSTSPVGWDDIAGLEIVKKTVEEIIIWPMVRPDLFTGLLCPVKGLLLFGPPGTGKTLIGKCIANQCNAKFFSISSSSMTSKWFGEGEKLVRALFYVAKHFQPSVIFIDEVDSLLTARKNDEHESTRRIKTEFLVQLDGCGTSTDERILVIGATNRPQELDDAARRRFVKRLYVPLPNEAARLKIITSLISKQNQSLSNEEIEKIVAHTKGYSGADVMNLCKEAALGPIRDVKDISKAQLGDVRPISIADFHRALKNVKPSVCSGDVLQYLSWNKIYGSGSEETDK